MARPPPEECANCGANIPRNARACPECGADERTGWREQDIYDGIDLPGEEEEGATKRSSRDVNGLAWYWWVVGLALLLLFALGALALR